MTAEQFKAYKEFVNDDLELYEEWKQARNGSLSEARIRQLARKNSELLLKIDYLNNKLNELTEALAHNKLITFDCISSMPCG